MTKNKTKAWAELTADKFEQKLRIVRERSAKKIPARAVNGVHDDKADGGSYASADGICWWTNGFWAGLLWQAYSHTGDARYAEIAQYTEQRLDEAFAQYIGLHHDTGFMWLPSAVADYRITKNEKSRVRGMHAASLLAGRFNPAGYIRAWDNLESDDTSGWAIIDCMFNIPLLYWCSEETKIAITN